MFWFFLVCFQLILNTDVLEAFLKPPHGKQRRWWHSCGAVWLPRDVSMVPWVTSFTAKDLRLWQSGARFLQRLFVGFLVQPGKIYEFLFSSLICVGFVQIWSNSLGKSWICSEPNSRNMDEHGVSISYLYADWYSPPILVESRKCLTFGLLFFAGPYDSWWELLGLGILGDIRWLQWRLHMS